MANNNSPFGFVPIRRMGGEGAPVIGEYAIASGLGSNIGMGDLVKFAGGASALGYTLITPVTANSDVIVGVFAGVEYVPSNGDSPVFQKNWVSGTAPLAGTKIKALVYDDPRTIYKVQMSGALVAANIGLNCQWLTGTIVNGISGATLDSGNIATTNTHGFRIRKLFMSGLGSGTAGGNELGTYGVVECHINRSAFSNQIAGV